MTQNVFVTHNFIIVRFICVNFILFVLRRTVFQIVKALDEQRSSQPSIPSLFTEDVVAKRKKLVALIESILLEDFESVGKKARDILWRKVYYDPISTSKKLWKQQARSLQPDETFELVNFIKDAIKRYKTLILMFEDVFNLDLRHIIDFAIIANGAFAFEKKAEKEIYTVSEMGHAMETIHSFLVCLGDLHRYCIEFNFTEPDVSIGTSKELAARYYVEAFKLNPKIGMSHNQLGTLRAGENYEVDSIFHYLYSLCSPVPFELSEANVSRVFQQNVEALEKMEHNVDGFNVKDFMMQMILVVDIFFYDKEIGEFNTLCRTVLVSFKEYLGKNRRSHQADLTFQLTSILMLCLLKLKIKNSPKVHSLNAFLVAFCAEIVDVAIVKVDDFIASRKEDNLKFGDAYNRKFIEFDKKIKTARDGNRGMVKRQPENGHGSNQLSSESKVTSEEASGKSDAPPIKIAKKPPQSAPTAGNNRRRRKRCKASRSNSSSESETESLSDSESMNSDFDSYDEDFSDRYSSDEDGKSAGSDNEDVVIENEEFVYATDDVKMTNGDYSFQDGHESASDDVLIEDEQLVFPDDGDDDDNHSMRLKYKKKYAKIDPNLIIEFGEQNVGWMQSLKVLFDWLRLNNDVLISCYRSNPEFINVIMKLINVLNIDIFTRKIFFDRSLIKTRNVREGLRHLFDIRHQIATHEDVVFKKCVMFEELQRPLEWELNYKLQVTHEEDVILRNFKIVDFGFHLCKMKKFGYNFCARTRVFIEKTNRRRNRRQRKVSDERNGGMKKGRRRRNRDRKRRDSNCERFDRMAIKQEVEEFPSIEQAHQRNFRKGYLKTKTSEAVDKENEAHNAKEDNARQVDKKNELMGKLWLKSEIRSLESKKHSSVALTPYIMVDSKCLTDYLYIVKNLVKSKKFVVLIPKAGEKDF